MGLSVVSITSIPHSIEQISLNALIFVVVSLIGFDFCNKMERI